MPLQNADEAPAEEGGEGKRVLRALSSSRARGVVPPELKQETLMAENNGKRDSDRMPLANLYVGF